MQKQKHRRRRPKNLKKMVVVCLWPVPTVLARQAAKGQGFCVHCTRRAEINGGSGRSYSWIYFAGDSQCQIWPHSYSNTAWHNR
jgi:hypothetical protein